MAPTAMSNAGVEKNLSSSTKLYSLYNPPITAPTMRSTIPVTCNKIIMTYEKDK